MRTMSPSMAAAVDRWRHRGGRRRRRHRHGRHRDDLFRGRLARARRRDHGHRLAQPEGVHGHEDRAPGRAAGRRRLRALRRPRPRLNRDCPCKGARHGHEAGRLRGVRGARALVRRRRRDQAAARRDRRGERDGRRDAPAGARAAAARRGALLLRARRHLPEPRAEPAAAREPRVHRPQDARRGRRPRRRVRRRRRPLLLRRRHRRVRARRLRDGAAGRVDPREGARRQGHLRRARQLGGARDDRARGRRAAAEPCRPRVLQAPHARRRRRLRRRGLGALLLPRLLAGRLGRRPVPADGRAALEARPQALGAARAVPRRATS